MKAELKLDSFEVQKLEKALEVYERAFSLLQRIGKLRPTPLRRRLETELKKSLGWETDETRTQRYKTRCAISRESVQKVHKGPPKYQSLKTKNPYCRDNGRCESCKNLHFCRDLIPNCLNQGQPMDWPDHIVMAEKLVPREEPSASGEEGVI